jgi:hypothetical protein
MDMRGLADDGYGCWRFITRAGSGLRAATKRATLTGAKRDYPPDFRGKIISIVLAGFHNRILSPGNLACAQALPMRGGRAV